MSIDPNLTATVVNDAAASGRSIRAEAEYQRSVGLLTERAVADVSAYADRLDRATALQAAQERAEDERAAAPPAGATWNARGRYWEVSAPEYQEHEGAEHGEPEVVELEAPEVEVDDDEPEA